MATQVTTAPVAAPRVGVRRRRPAPEGGRINWGLTVVIAIVSLIILIPLYFASLSPEQLALLDTEVGDRRGRALYDVLLEWWSDWFNDITYADAIRIDWIKARLRCEPVMLIFDGIDEFLTNHPALRMADFQQVLAFLGSEYRQNGWLTIVCGVRSTQPGLPLLGSSNLREVLRLTTAQAIRQFPTASNWLTADSDAYGGCVAI